MNTKNIVSDQELLKEYIISDLLLEEVAEVFDTDIEYLFKIIEDFDKSHKISVENRKLICKLYYRSNFSTKEIANFAKCGDSSITEVIDYYGIKRRSKRITEETQARVKQAVDYYMEHPNTPVKDILSKFSVSKKQLYSQMPKDIKRRTQITFIKDGVTIPIDKILKNHDGFSKININEYDSNHYTKALFYLTLFSRSVRLYNCKLDHIGNIVYRISVKQYDPEREIKHNPELVVCTDKHNAINIANEMLEFINGNISINVSKYEYKNRFYKLVEEIIDYKN